MEMKKVESSNIQAVGWEDEVLEVSFVKGGTYRYTGVPEEIYKAFMSSPSKGKFFHARIRPKQFDYMYEKIG
jgi:hypothetical protein